MELAITTEQATYLNKLARVARLYRVTTERITEDLTLGLTQMKDGFDPNGIRSQDLTDITKAAAQLDALTEMSGHVFPYPDTEDRDVIAAHGLKIRGYLRAAMNLDTHDYILIKH